MSLRAKIATALSICVLLFAFFAASVAAQSCYAFVNSAWTSSGRAYIQYAVDCSPIGGSSSATMRNNNTGGYTTQYTYQGATRVYRVISLPDTGSSYNLSVRMPNGVNRNLGNWYL